MKPALLRLVLPILVSFDNPLYLPESFALFVDFLDMLETVDYFLPYAGFGGILLIKFSYKIYFYFHL